MTIATLSEKGQLVIPARIRRRFGLTAGTQVEFVDDDGSIRLVVRRKAAASSVADGYGMVKVQRAPDAEPRRLSDFDPARLLAKPAP